MLPVTSRQLIEEFIASDLTEGCVDVTCTGRTNISVYQALHAFLKRNSKYNVTVRMHRGDVMLVKNGEQGTVTRIH